MRWSGARRTVGAERRLGSRIATRLLAASAALVAFCAAAQTPRPEPAGELRVGVARLPETLDPAVTPPGPGWVVSRQLFEGLVEVGARGELEPALASQWTVSRDGLIWTFRLRADVQFHNGRPLTADVVVASLARLLGVDDAAEALEPGLAVWRGRGAIVREVRQGEGGTVRIQLAQPFSPLLAVLAHPALAVVLPDSDSGVPFLGTGPYRVAEQSPGRLVLQATGAPAAASGERPRAARLVFEEIGDDAAGAGELGPRGRVDVYFPQSPPTWGGLGLQSVSGPTWQMGLLACRTRQGLAARKPIRQAVALALDPALVRPALGRAARLHAGYLPPGTWAARPAAAPAADPVRARRLVTEGRGAGGTLTLLVPEGGGEIDTARLAEAIRLSLAAAGLTVQVRQPDGDAYARGLRQGEGELALLETTASLDDPHFQLRPLLASDAAALGTGTNVASYRNEAVDSLLLRASQLAFRPERLRLYQRLQAQLAEDLPYIPLYVRLQWALARPSVRDLRLDPLGRHRLDRAWVEPAPGPPGTAPAPGGTP